jgi:di/tricarboxylate transporter
MLHSLDTAKEKQRNFHAEAVIPLGSPLIGKVLRDVSFANASQYEVVDLIRDERGARTGISHFIARAIENLKDSTGGSQTVARSTFRDIALKEGDRLVFRTDKITMMELKKEIGLNFGNQEGGVLEPISLRETMIAEGTISADSPMIDKTIGELRLRRRYGCYILAVHRHERDISDNFEDLKLEADDVLLIEGPKEELERLFEQQNLLSVSQIRSQSFDRKRAPIAIIAIFSVVTLATFEVMPIAGLSLVAAMVVIMTGCIPMNRIQEIIEWRILMLIFGMLGISEAMDSTGTARIIVEFLAGLMEGFGPIAVLAIVYFVASALTEIMSNNAVAVLLTPIAIGIAHSLGQDPRPFIAAIMFGASASFSTPIGYQTNTYVYNIGNYKFKDFLIIGTPMNLLSWVVSVAAIAWWWDMF